MLVSLLEKAESVRGNRYIGPFLLLRLVNVFPTFMHTFILFSQVCMKSNFLRIVRVMEIK